MPRKFREFMVYRRTVQSMRVIAEDADYAIALGEMSDWSNVECDGDDEYSADPINGNEEERDDG